MRLPGSQTQPDSPSSTVIISSHRGRLARKSHPRPTFKGASIPWKAWGMMGHRTGKQALCTVDYFICWLFSRSRGVGRSLENVFTRISRPTPKFANFHPRWEHGISPNSATFQLTRNNTIVDKITSYKPVNPAMVEEKPRDTHRSLPPRIWPPKECPDKPVHVRTGTDV